MRMLCTFLAAAAIAAPIAPAAAQPETAERDSIVVEGHKSQRQQIRSYVRTLTPLRMDEQIGRFINPVCPSVVGLAAHETTKVTARFRQVAEASGVPLAAEPCRANVVIIAVKSKRAFIESIPRYAPALVEELSARRIAALARSAGPVAAWQVVGLADQNGLSVAGMSLDSDNPASAVPVATSNDGSRLNKSTQASFAVSVLVVERQALANVSTRQLADYAAMRTLAPVDPLSKRHELSGNPESTLPAPSILSLFDRGRTPTEAPESVTWWDFAFLQALYDMRMTRAAYLQRGEIQRRMNHILAGAPPEEL